MRRANRLRDSAILTQQLRYISGNSPNNKNIALILWDEQQGFCAYTDEHLSRTDAQDVEHFNPTLKDTPQDNYENWLLVKHRWNNEKKSKWGKFQPCLLPTADDFEDRIKYIGGDYVAAEDDDEAQKLIELLKLDDPALADKRKGYIKTTRNHMELDGREPKEFFKQLLKTNRPHVHYSRAIREEFGVDILELIN